MSSLNQTPTGERTRIAFFGMRNAGKSSLVNKFTNQTISIVSDVKGTTTDPVYKAMELLPLGPVQIIDTPGLDDEGELGAKRVMRAMDVLNVADMVIIVVDGVHLTKEIKDLRDVIIDRKLPYIIAFNKADKYNETKDLKETNFEEIKEQVKTTLDKPDALKEGFHINVSAKTGLNIDLLRDVAAAIAGHHKEEKVIVSDLLKPGDTVVLVVPIDKSAPKGRLILPQQQVIRDLLDNNITAMVTTDEMLADTMTRLVNPPNLVITDSQIFGFVNKTIDPSVPLTSFSILMARYKGDLPLLIKGASAIKDVKEGDKLLISEGCTHHIQCEDIGTVKLPRWIKEFTECTPEFFFTQGKEFPGEFEDYKAVIHCGGCMLGEKEMKNRIKNASSHGVPVTNYGILIAYMNGILKRSVAIFPEIPPLD